MLLHGMNHGAGDQSYRPFLLSTCQQSSPVWRPWWRATPGWSAAFSAHSAWAVSTPPMKSKIVVLRAGSPGLCGPSAMPSPRQNCKAWARTQGLSPLWAQPCLGPGLRRSLCPSCTPLTGHQLQTGHSAPRSAFHHFTARGRGALRLEMEIPGLLPGSGTS